MKTVRLGLLLLKLKTFSTKLVINGSMRDEMDPEEDAVVEIDPVRKFVRQATTQASDSGLTEVSDEERVDNLPQGMNCAEDHNGRPRVLDEVDNARRMLESPMRV